MTVLLEYLDLSIPVAGHSKDLDGPAPPLATPLDFAKFRDMLLYNMPIMPALCLALAYYVSITLDALACLLCLKLLCWHNRRRRSSRTYTAHSMMHEVLTSIISKAVLSKYHDRRTELEALQVNSQSDELTGEKWNTTKEHADTIQATLQVYFKEKALLSQFFDYWNTCVSNVFLIFKNLTMCCRDWILYLNAIERETGFSTLML